MSEDNKHEHPIFTQAPPEARAKVLQHDVEEIRDDLTSLFNELDRRRHNFFDVKRQLSRHAIAVGVFGLGVVGLVAGVWALAARHRQRREVTAA